MTTPPMASPIAIVTLAVLAGCWVEQETVSGAIWSDDDEMFAITLTHYEVRARDADEQSGDTTSRDHSHQIYIMPSDLSADPEPIGDRKHGTPKSYLMSGAGYLATTWILDGQQESYQYFLGGDSRKIIDEDDLPILTTESDHRSYQLIPSPGGDVFAIHLSEGTESSGISVLDAFTLEPLFADESLPFGRIIWNPDNQLVFLSDSIEGALALNIGDSEWASVAEPNCGWPPTTSGPVSEAGRIIGPGSSLHDPVEFDADIGESAGAPNVPFGCP